MAPVSGCRVYSFLLWAKPDWPRPRGSSRLEPPKLWIGHRSVSPVQAGGGQRAVKAAEGRAVTLRLITSRSLPQGLLRGLETWVWKQFPEASWGLKEVRSPHRTGFKGMHLSWCTEPTLGLRICCILKLFVHRGPPLSRCTGPARGRPILLQCHSRGESALPGEQGKGWLPSIGQLPVM